MKTRDMDSGSGKHLPAAAAQDRGGVAGSPLQQRIEQSPRMLAQRQAIDTMFGGAAQRAAHQEREAASANETGMPDTLKSGVEALSGMDLSDVRVHRNSAEPAGLGALAYAQGNDIHLGPGQEQHLPHEAWHVVQQRQGRVQATTQMKGGTPVNDDPALEHEADAMGARAAALGQQGVQRVARTDAPATPAADGAIQLVRDRLPATTTVRVVDDGFTRLARLRTLIDESAIVLDQITEIFDFEPIKKRAATWYQALSPAIKAARVWLSENEPRNQYERLLVPDDVFFDLALPYVAYRRELDDSYEKFAEVIESVQASIAEKYRDEREEVEGAGAEEAQSNPLSRPKWLYRWVSTEEAKRALKDGITFDGEGGGIPTSTKADKGVAITSGAVSLNRCLAIDTSLIPGFAFEYVSTRSKLKEVKIKCDVPAAAISKA